MKHHFTRRIEDTDKHAISMKIDPLCLVYNLIMQAPFCEGLSVTQNIDSTK